MACVWTALLTISSETTRTTSEACGVLVNSAVQTCQAWGLLRSWLRNPIAWSFSDESDAGFQAMEIASSICRGLWSGLVYETSEKTGLGKVMAGLSVFGGGDHREGPKGPPRGAPRWVFCGVVVLGWGKNKRA